MCNCLLCVSKTSGVAVLNNSTVFLYRDSEKTGVSAIDDSRCVCGDSERTDVNAPDNINMFVHSVTKLVLMPLMTAQFLQGDHERTIPGI